MRLDQIDIQRTKRKTILLGVDKNDFHVYVRAPLYASEAEILRFVNSKADWIAKQTERLKAAQAQVQNAPTLSADQLEALAKQAKAFLPGRVAYYAPLLGVTYGRITIRCQKTRWGSCSSKGNLNFNCLLMLMPAEMIDYTVVHELCHRKEMNHSKRFYALLASILPDYQQRQRWIRQNGARLMAMVK